MASLTKELLSKDLRDLREVGREPRGYLAHTQASFYWGGPVIHSKAEHSVPLGLFNQS